MEVTSQFLEISQLDARPEFALEAFKLIEESFNYSNNNQFTTDFHPLTNKENWRNCHIVIDKEKNIVIAFIGMIIRDLTYQDIKIPVCLLGGISVHANYRGKGVFKFFMNNIITRFEKYCGLFMLWSGDPSLYLKFGFHLTGEQFETITSNSDDMQLFTKTKLINMSSKEIDQIQKIYQNIISKNFLTFNREHHDWDGLKNITSADLYIKKNISNEVEEYFIVHKGEDLANIVYENSSILTEKYYSLSPFKIWSPIKSKNPSKDNTHYTCMTRLGSAEHFNSFVQQISLNMINIIEFNIESNYISFYFKGDKITTGINDFICGLLGPGQFEEIRQFLPKLYISGLDSI